MQTAYIYSVSRTNAMAEELLSMTDIDRLMVATPGEDLQSALKETYLAPFLLRVSSGEVADAIEQTLIDAKKLIHRIAPQGDMFRPLWVQYDIHNLRVFAKATAKGLEYATVAHVLSQRGIYEPTDLYEAVKAGSLNSLQEDWQASFNEALQLIEKGELDKVDTVFDELYFSTSKRITARVGDMFMQRYLIALINIYNLKSRLRVLRYPQLEEITVFIDGGTLTNEQLENEDTVLKALDTMGTTDFWKPGIEYYLETGNSTRLDARADEYLLDLAHRVSVEHFMFNSAGLVEYYLKCRQAAANIRTIVVGKNSGMNDEDIRANLRLAYVND